MNTIRQWGCADLDFIIFTAVISSAVLLHPLFAIGLPAMLWLRPAPAVKSRRRSATVHQLPTEKPAVDHHTRKAA